jgi:hypothetical protein
VTCKSKYTSLQSNDVFYRIPKIIDLKVTRHNNITLGRSRKDSYPPPTEEIFAVRRGREEKCLRMSEGGERKNVLGCPKGGRGMWICLSEGLRL